MEVKESLHLSFFAFFLSEVIPMIVQETVLNGFILSFK